MEDTTTIHKCHCQPSQGTFISTAAINNLLYFGNSSLSPLPTRAHLPLWQYHCAEWAYWSAANLGPVAISITAVYCCAAGLALVVTGSCFAQQSIKGGAAGAQQTDAQCLQQQPEAAGESSGVMWACAPHTCTMDYDHGLGLQLRHDASGPHVLARTWLTAHRQASCCFRHSTSNLYGCGHCSHLAFAAS